MRVLEVIGGLNRGGAETLLVNILEHVNDKDIKYDLLVYEKKEYDYSDKVKELGANIIYVESPSKIGIINFIIKLKRIIKNNRYDVVHAHTLFNCGPVMLSAFLANVKIRISHSHNTQILEENPSFVKKVYFKLSKLMLNLFSTDAIACGEDAGKFLFYKRKKFIVIRNGIDIYKYKYNNAFEKKLKAKYKIGENTLIFGNIGRLNFQKNQVYLLDVFKVISVLYPNSLLFIIGDGELKESLLQYAKKLNIDDKVIFTGNIANANEYYSLFDCFLFPSKFEGLPYTLIEAQANGLPIIASDQITEEVNISKYINFMPITKSNLENWANEAIELASDHLIKDNDQSIISSGYSIVDTVELLEKIYKRSK